MRNFGLTGGNEVRQISSPDRNLLLTEHWRNERLPRAGRLSGITSTGREFCWPPASSYLDMATLRSWLVGKAAQMILQARHVRLPPLEAETARRMIRRPPGAEW